MSDPSWSVQAARALYHVPGWSAGFFDISDAGRVVMSAHAEAGRGIDLVALAERLRADGIELPVLVRFEDILEARIDQLVAAFDTARRRCYFSGPYTAIYPIKVNQQRHVVEHILRHGGERVGLEAGSKTELLAVLAISRPGGVVVCNGYKDRDFIRLAFIAQLLGQRVYIVIEKPAELDHVFAVAEELGIDPVLGVRVRLATVARGNWQNTGGEKSKFGLTAAQLLALVARLRARGKLHWLQLLHVHMGSQISSLADIRRGLGEAGRCLVALARAGAVIRVFDVGGGLGVDYEGTRSDRACSIDYRLADYAEAIVRQLSELCVREGLPAVEIFTEAGRAMTAHHAVLITQVVDVERQVPDGADLADFAPLAARIGIEPAARLLSEAERRLHGILARFTAGEADLARRAAAEQAFLRFCRRLADWLAETDAAEDEPVRERLRERLADKCFLNFSLFQSLPDVWALDQIFPVLPLQRLDERPTRDVTLHDLTCDSDGRIDWYAHSGGVHSTLPLHAIRPGEDYLIGLFMVGAYQEILGDIHNLFGDTHSVNVRRRPEGGFELRDFEPGDRAEELLRYVHFDSAKLLNACRRKIAQTGLPEAVRRQLNGTLSAALSGYTYLNHDGCCGRAAAEEPPPSEDD